MPAREESDCPFSMHEVRFFTAFFITVIENPENSRVEKKEKKTFLSKLFLLYYFFFFFAGNILCYFQNVNDTWNLDESPSGLDLAGERLAHLSELNESEIKKCASEENSIVYGQVWSLKKFDNFDKTKKFLICYHLLRSLTEYLK